MEFSAGILYENLSNRLEFLENCVTGNNTLPGGLSGLLPLFPYLLTDLAVIGIEDFLCRLLNNLKFRRNTCSEIHALLAEINEYLPIFIACFIQFW
jgi:hypothetical protein